MPFTPFSVPGTVHRFTPQLSAFELSTPSSSTQTESSPPNTLLWVGGLGDGLLTVSYVRHLAASLPPTWTLAQVLLSSAYNGWGMSSIAKDAAEIGQCVAYFRKLRPGTKVVLMGHSTGTQDLAEYVTGKGADAREKVDGIALQAPVSDREALYLALGEKDYNEGVAAAREFVEQGRGEDVLPSRFTKDLMGPAPVCARRWLDLTSPGPEHRGADDYFSSDLGEKRWGEWCEAIARSKTPVCFLYGGSDEFVPKSVDKEALVKTWMRLVKEAGGSVDDINGGIVPGASHNLMKSPDEVVKDLIKRVVGFLGKVDGAEFGAKI
ncbi:uncharacterized protein J3D65DRAFT_272117 [Phyllosticta citribraziliensis]|uniref:DUF1749-domain-containing protein n=1 Tax=Phyllosticta citribraziliensis TaxID=989973 RepID=A0ABR1M181_9PEZI